MAQQATSFGAGWPDDVTTRLLDLSVDLTCVASFDGYFTELSPGWTERLGYDEAELRSHPLLDFVHPDDVDSTAARLAAGRDGSDTTSFDNRFIARDGSPRWLAWTAVAVPSQHKYFAVARDRTPQRWAEEKERESERRYADLIESSHDIIQSITPDGHFEFVNKAWHDHLGYTAEELPDLTLFDIVEETFHDHCTILISQIMSGRSFDSVEITFVAKNGRRFPVEGNATGRFRDGEFVATHTFFRDISDRKEAEELAAQYRSRLEAEVAERTLALVQSEKLATLGRLSAGMAHELNNPAAAAQRGASLLGDELSATFTQFLDLAANDMDPTEAEQVASLLSRSASRARTPDTLDLLSRSDREADVEDWLVDHGIPRAWELADPVVGLGLHTDDLDDMAGMFPPQDLAAVLSLMTHSYNAFRLLAQVGHGSEQIVQIVRALKSYSFMDQAPVQDVDIHEGLDNTLIMLQGKLKSGVEVQREYGTDVPRIEALGSELNQVWTNLIDNAIDAMEGSGRLRIRTSVEPRDDRDRGRDDDSPRTTAMQDGWVVVEIEDDGPGIPAEVLDKVFDPFFTTKLPGKGTGLGLNIVFNMIRGSGGRIEVDSRPGRTVFTVRLPLQGTPDDVVDTN